MISSLSRSATPSKTLIRLAGTIVPGDASQAPSTSSFHTQFADDLNAGEYL